MTNKTLVEEILSAKKYNTESIDLVNNYYTNNTVPAACATAILELLYLCKQALSNSNDDANSTYKQLIEISQKMSVSLLSLRLNVDSLISMINTCQISLNPELIKLEKEINTNFSELSSILKSIKSTLNSIG